MNDTHDAARESSRRLRELLRREHAALADFLVALSEFDGDRLWMRLGYPNLFVFLHREMGLSRGAAHYRKVATRLVQEFPEVVEPLRDGRLCLSAVLELARVITSENRAEVLPRFFHCSKREAKAVGVEIAPTEVVPRREVVTALPLAETGGATAVLPPSVASHERSPVHPDERHPTHPGGVSSAAALPPKEIAVPMTSELRRLHVTVSTRFIAKLDRAKAGQSHVEPDASAEQVLEAALDLLLAQQERRRSSVPAKVKREVRRRDGSRCQWPTHDGGVCGATVRTEIDHMVPRGRGGASTVENCRVLCRAHNLEAARRVYGDAYMDRFAPRTALAREPEAPWDRSGHRTGPGRRRCHDRAGTVRAPNPEDGDPRGFAAFAPCARTRSWAGAAPPPPRGAP